MTDSKEAFYEIRRSYRIKRFKTVGLWLLLQLGLFLLTKNIFLHLLLAAAFAFWLLYVLSGLYHSRAWKLLTDDLNFAGFEEYLKVSGRKDWAWYLAFLRGDFEQAKEEMDRFDLAKAKKPISKIAYWGNYASIAIFAGQEELYKGYIQELRSVSCEKEKEKIFQSDRLDNLEALAEILLQKKANTFFYHRKEKDKLDHLMVTYFLALNAQLAESWQIARERFEEVAQANPQLYIVRRAKEELEKMELEGLVSRGNE